MMARKLVLLIIAMAMLTPAWAAPPLGAAPPLEGAISGTVRDSAGIAQMGATVQFFETSLLPAATVFTDVKGFFRAENLEPGTYYVKVSAPSFLPALRESVALKSGASLVVDFTLNTLFEAVQMLPTRRRVSADEDDWKWTLRSTANRPILRVFEDEPLWVVSNGENGEKTLKARVMFLTNSDSRRLSTSPDMSTSFKVERSLFSSGTLAVGGNVGYNGSPTPVGVLRTSYSHVLDSGSEPEIAVTMRRFTTADMASHDLALQALAVSLSDNFSVADFADLRFGSEYQAIQYLGRVSAARPFGSVRFHLSPKMLLEYQYATSVPNMREWKGFDSAPADLSESGPRVSLVNFSPVIERAHHHEIALSRRLGSNNVQFGVYSDGISNPALTGVGTVTVDTGQFLPDLYAGTFTWNGPALRTNGLRAVVQRKLSDNLTATVDYAYGGVLALEEGGPVSWTELRSGILTERRHSVAYKMSGTLPASHTRWVASYRWTSGTCPLTPVDMFNASPGQTDPYLSIFLRQPLPGVGFIPGRMEALVDVRNLLAQGYVPILGEGGRALYLTQSARSLRGGLAFTF
jgi:hypothetical protein